MPAQYFFNLGIVYYVTELNNGKQKIGRKKENEKFVFYETSFPLFQICFLCKIKFLIPMVSLAPPPRSPPMLLAKLRLQLSGDTAI
jgi:hypothetical protein